MADTQMNISDTLLLALGARFLVFATLDGGTNVAEIDSPPGSPRPT